MSPDPMDKALQYGFTSRSAIEAEFEKMNGYWESEMQAAVLRRYIEAMLPPPSLFRRANHWLRYLPLRTWHRIEDAVERWRLRGNRYRCEVCRGIFVKGWTDEEARAEEASTFGRSRSDSVLVCDDCYKAMGFDA